ncbi:MAG TPA: hypothetical protein VLT36_18760 [Candidatus Dormibacteraeota bacterium]|nr:hypothetical protein [Candidatus Dormibacteraeota bacterium]
MAAFAFGSTAFAQYGFGGNLGTRSVSGQFLVFDRRATGASQTAAYFGTNSAFIQLDPTLLIVSCERIKQELFQEIGAKPNWSGRIYLVLHPAESTMDTVGLTSEKFRDTWQYRLDLPDVLPRRTYVRGLVQAMLLEMANRQAFEHTAEIPSWLIEGLTQQLLAANELEIILSPPSKAVNGLTIGSTFTNRIRENPLEHARQELKSHPMLGFNALSWPDDRQLAGDDGELFFLNSQLFLKELLRENEGHARMRMMLEQLPQHYNWQFALLDAYHDMFPRLVDIEKWWVLHYVRFTGLEKAKTWAPIESWNRLDDTLHAHVQIRANINEIPLHTDIPLQVVLREWDGPQQTATLRTKLREIEMLRWRIDPHLVNLLDEYHQTIETYLAQEQKHGFTLVPFFRKSAQEHARYEALKRLDELDARKKAAKPPDNVATVKASL